MGEVLLAGGPRDGRRITVSDGSSTVMVAYARPVPWPPPPEPRPSWWRHPVRWFRWKPPPPPPVPEVTQLAYRDTGKAVDGARVFEIDGDWPWFRGPEAAGDGDLYCSLLAAWEAVHPVIRGAVLGYQDLGTRWVMNPDWYRRVRATAGSRAYPDPDPDDLAKYPHDYLLGVPVTVTDDGGAPHIENRRYPADF